MLIYNILVITFLLLTARLLALSETRSECKHQECHGIKNWDCIWFHFPDSDGKPLLSAGGVMTFSTWGTRWRRIRSSVLCCCLWLLVKVVCHYYDAMITCILLCLTEESAYGSTNLLQSWCGCPECPIILKQPVLPCWSCHYSIWWKRGEKKRVCVLEDMKGFKSV